MADGIILRWEFFIELRQKGIEKRLMVKGKIVPKSGKNTLAYTQKKSPSFVFVWNSGNLPFDTNCCDNTSGKPVELSRTCEQKVFPGSPSPKLAYEYISG